MRQPHEPEGSPLWIDPALARLAPEIAAVRIPIPGPLKSVNCYVLEGPEGLTVVDTGFHTGVCEQTWQAALAALGRGFDAISQIVVTHFHPDHFGAAGWLQERSGAPVLMLDRARTQVQEVWGQPEKARAMEASYFAQAGMPAPQMKALDDYFSRQGPRVLPLPKVDALHEGQEVSMGGRSYSVLWMPGHAPGLAVFLDRERHLLVGNDLVLSGITPNVSQFWNGPPFPLAQFYASLGAVGGLDIALTLTGHRGLIADTAGRAGEILRHHDERLQKVEAIVASAGAGDSGASAWEVCEALFGTYASIHQTRFALAETVAHLEYLVYRRRLDRVEGTVTQYTP